MPAEHTHRKHAIAIRVILLIALNYLMYVGGTVVMDGNPHPLWRISFSGARISSIFFCAILLIGAIGFFRYHKYKKD